MTNKNLILGFALIWFYAIFYCIIGLDPAVHYHQDTCSILICIAVATSMIVYKIDER